MASPATATDVADAPAAVVPPTDEVTVYPVIGLPPLEVGAVQVTVALAFPAVAVPMVGGPGAVETAAVLVSLKEAGVKGLPETVAEAATE